MGRIVVVTMSDLTCPTGNNDFDFVEIDAGANNKFRVLAVELTSDVTAAAVVRLRMCGRAANGTGGSGTGVNNNNMDEDDAASSLTSALGLVTTPGATVRRFVDTFWKQTRPWRWVPTPEAQPVVEEGEIFAVNVQDGVAASTSWTGFVVIEEI